MLPSFSSVSDFKVAPCQLGPVLAPTLINKPGFFIYSLFEILLSVSVCRTPQLASQTGSETASRWQQGAQTTSQQLAVPMNPMISLKQVQLQSGQHWKVIQHGLNIICKLKHASINHKTTKEYLEQTDGELMVFVDNLFILCFQLGFAFSTHRWCRGRSGWTHTDLGGTAWRTCSEETEDRGVRKPFL